MVDLDGGLVDAGPGEPERRMGIALNGTYLGGMEEPFADQLAFMDTLGATFIGLPLDWSTLEPGPDDDFSYTGLDTNRWTTNTVGPVPTSDDDVMTYVGTDDESGFARSTYQLSGSSWRVSAEVTAPAMALDSSTLSLLVEMDDDGDGPGCGGGDAFVSIVLFKYNTGLGAPAIVMLSCSEMGLNFIGGLQAVSAPLDEIHLSIARSGDELQFYVDNPVTPLATLDISGSAALAETGRPALYFNGDNNSTPGEVRYTVDNWRVGPSEVVWDDPADRYSVNPGYFDILATVNAVYPGLDVGLSLRTINTNATVLPSDLQALIDPGTGKVAFDDPRVASRFADFSEHVLSTLSDDIDIAFVSVGNEIDIYLGNDPDAFDAYVSFVQSAAPTLRSQLATLQATSAGAPVGAKLTEGAFHLGAVQTSVDDVLAASDVAMVNYYPLNATFGVDGSGAITTAFDEIATRVPSEQLIYLTEFGVHSSSDAAPFCGLDCGGNCNSSEQIQADRYAELFAAWDAHADRMPLVYLNWLTDVPCTTLDGWAVQYGSTDGAFLAYLGSLGLRTRDGLAKPALTVISTEAAARGIGPSN